MRNKFKWILEAISESNLSNLWPFRRRIVGLLLVALLSYGCTTTGYNINIMPKYDSESNLDEYNYITELLTEYLFISGIAAQLGDIVTKEGHKKMVPSIDKYIYWYSVANIHWFHGDYKNMKIAIDNAQVGLNEVKTILLEIANNNPI